MDRTNTIETAYNQSRIQRVRLENCSIKILLREHPYIYIYIYIFFFYLFIFLLNPIIEKYNQSHKNERRSILHLIVKSVK